VYHLAIEPGGGVPIAQVHDALREFVATRVRPTCVDWLPVSC
jgi:hypothetical protein